MIFTVLKTIQFARVVITAAISVPPAALQIVVPAILQHLITELPPQRLINAYVTQDG